LWFLVTLRLARGVETMTFLSPYSALLLLATETTRQEERLASMLYAYTHTRSLTHPSSLSISQLATPQRFLIATRIHCSKNQLPSAYTALEPHLYHVVYYLGRHKVQCEITSSYRPQNPIQSQHTNDQPKKNLDRWTLSPSMARSEIPPSCSSSSRRKAER